MSGSLARVPIRLRVTLAFTAVIALVLVAAGFFLYFQLRSNLDESIDTNLRTRSGEVSALVRASDSGVSGTAAQAFIEQEESFAQVLSADGSVVDSTPQLGGEPVLTSAELAEVGTGATYFEREGLPGIEGSGRLLATEVDAGGRELYVVVGSSLGDRAEALASLRGVFLIGGPIALLLASLAGYWAAGTALGPVEAMRRRAAEISAEGPTDRLPVPPAGDELTRLGETLNAMLARLEDAIERERRFVNDAAHELRTPLALHKTELELALRHGADADGLRRAIASASEEVDRLIQLAEDLLVVARSEDGGLEVKPEGLSAESLLASVAERFRARADELGRRLTTDGDGVVLHGDRLRLEQALTNVVDNALRHGGGEVRISAAAEDGAVRLTVSDAGPGFPPGFAARAFERFSRADTARGRGGTGLGLSIVDTIARAHGGTAGASNRPGGGAEVWIELPSAG